jgi:uncharacterized protein YraI
MGMAGAWAVTSATSLTRRAVVALVVMTVFTGCSGSAGGGTEVTGVAEGDFLRLRAGPGLGYHVILGLPDGTAVRRLGCVTEAGQLWCQIVLADAPGIAGFVSADYLLVP